MTTALQVHLPQALLSLAESYVREGGAADMDQLLAEALRRYLDSHRSTLRDAHVREDIAWGLHGRD